VTSELAYINAEMTTLRAPIEGQLQLERIQAGTLISRGTPLFRVENPRFGNQQTSAQLNWLRELAARLNAEAEEAVARCRHQEQVYALHQKLHEEKLLSRLAFLEEGTKLALARTAMTNRQGMARQAEDRMKAIESQVELESGAVVEMPFDGLAWSIPARSGAQVSARETVVEVIDPHQIRVDAFFHERHAGRLTPGAAVKVRALDGAETWKGRVESIRGGVGRIAYEGFAAAMPGESFRRRVAVRVILEASTVGEASRFFGVGRSVVVTLEQP
jgi:multidrug resistance efflux pump